MKNSRCVLRNLAVLAGMDCAATLGGKLFAALGVPETNIVVLYLFAVLLVTRLTQGYQYGILASVTSLLCFNFYFTAPYHTFAVNDPSYLITFFVMLVTSLLTSAMTTKEKILTRQANERGEESRILYMLSSRLSDAADTEQVLGVALDSVSKLLQADAGCVYLGGQGQPIALQQVGGADHSPPCGGRRGAARPVYRPAHRVPGRGGGLLCLGTCMRDEAGPAGKASGIPSGMSYGNRAESNHPGAQYERQSGLLMKSRRSEGRPPLKCTSHKIVLTGSECIKRGITAAFLTFY